MLFIKTLDTFRLTGKSTFLRQNALIAILAQAGSFVPAQSAAIGMYKYEFQKVTLNLLKSSLYMRGRCLIYRHPLVNHVVFFAFTVQELWIESLRGLEPAIILYSTSQRSCQRCWKRPSFSLKPQTSRLSLWTK